jgi:hypothetical protein
MSRLNDLLNVASSETLNDLSCNHYKCEYGRKGDYPNCNELIVYNRRYTRSIERFDICFKKLKELAGIYHAQKTERTDDNLLKKMTTKMKGGY